MTVKSEAYSGCSFKGVKNKKRRGPNCIFQHWMWGSGRCNELDTTNEQVIISESYYLSPYEFYFIKWGFWHHSQNRLK